LGKCKKVREQRNGGQQRKVLKLWPRKMQKGNLITGCVLGGRGETVVKNLALDVSAKTKVGHGDEK